MKVALFTSDEVKQLDQSGNLVQTTENRFPPAEKLVTQTSISGFRGLVTINLQDKSQPATRFNAFTLDALYEYEIINPTEMESRVVFRFPLSSSTMIYRDIQFLVNGEEVSSFQIISGMITWNGRLKPGETASISVHYLASGMDWFGYYSGDTREVKNFSLTVRVDDDGNYTLLTLPNNGGIKLNTSYNPPYTDITWTIEKAILAPNLAISLNQNWSYAPYGSLIETMGYSSRALIFCISLIVLTLMIFGVVFRIKQVVLLAFLFAFPHFILMSGVLTAIAQSKYVAFQILLLPVLAIISLLLVFIILKQQARLTITQIAVVLSLMALFIIGYPRIGLLSDEPMRNSAEGIVQVLMIGYVFALALAIRIRMVNQSKRKSKQPQVVK